MSLHFENVDGISRQQGSPDNFTGTVYVQSIADNEERGLKVARVTFEKGARTHWHTHAGEQVLYFLNGRGRVQERGGPVFNAAVGDVARISAGTEHWHGAHPEEGLFMQHLAITFGDPTWLEPVSGEDYEG